MRPVRSVRSLRMQCSCSVVLALAQFTDNANMSKCRTDLITVRLSPPSLMCCEPKCTFCVMSSLWCDLSRRHLLPKPNRALPVGKNVSDKDNLLLSATCVKVKLQTIPEANSLDMVHNLYENMFVVCQD